MYFHVSKAESWANTSRHFVLFRVPDFYRAKHKLRKEAWVLSDLARPPDGQRWGEEGWDDGTSQWVL
jgi:hypothetical protein